MKKIIYIHLDMISNAVLSKGLSLADFQQAMSHQPENILLLNPASDEGEYETHTGLRIIRSKQKVNQYLTLAARRHDQDVKWLDFNDLHLLKQLTPVEISELLYFGHAKTHLHSPFFYKLQNNYVFLNLSDEVNKIYYRYLDDFYQVLALRLVNELRSHLNERRGLFRRAAVNVAPLPLEILQRLRPILQEGIVFHFGKLTQLNSDYQIPIYLVEDQLRNVEELHYNQHMKMGTLIYQSAKQNWRIELEDWDSLINMHAL